MICPTCQREIPDGEHRTPQLLCPACLAAKSYQALLEFTRQFVAGLRSGEHPVTLTRPPSWWRWHFQLAPHPQAWCGEPVGRRWAVKQLRYPEIDTKRYPLCEKCVQVFQELKPLEVA